MRGKRKLRALAALAAALASTLSVSVAARADAGGATPPPRVPPPSAAGAAQRSATEYYLSLGDSYAVGYQSSVGHTTLHGPANQLVRLAAKRGYHLTLVNFGCAGATTESLLGQRNCPADGRMPGAAGYPGQTQVQAATAFIRKHPGQVRLVTISIGGNDVDGCIATPHPIGCVAAHMPAATANLERALRQLRAAGGSQLRIIGSTYPDVALGAWVRPDVFGDNRYALATESLTAFRRYINPGLDKAYRSVRATLVDVTAATGAYGPFVTTNDPSYGIIPVPVAAVCRLTFFCIRLDIHMTTAGYGIIARLEAQLLPPLEPSRRTFAG